MDFTRPALGGSRWCSQRGAAVGRERGTKRRASSAVDGRALSVKRPWWVEYPFLSFLGLDTFESLGGWGGFRVSSYLLRMRYNGVILHLTCKLFGGSFDEDVPVEFRERCGALQV